MNHSAVNSGRLKYPRASPAQPASSSSHHVADVACKPSSRCIDCRKLAKDAVRNLHAFWLAGGGGGVDDTGQRLGSDLQGQIFLGLAPHLMPVLIQAEKAGGHWAWYFQQVLLGKQGVLTPASFSIEAMRSAGEIGSSGICVHLEEAQKRHDHKEGPLQEDAYPRTWTHVHPVCEPSGWPRR